MAMQEYQYFKHTGDPEINAAVVGISAEDWVYAESTTNSKAASLKMKGFEFDILPKINKDRTITGYYHTTEWGKYSEENIRWAHVNANDLIYYLTHIRDVIRLLYLNKRNFYFLSNHSSIVGLITVSNLNCRSVSLFYYNLINSFERELGRFVYENLDVAEILESLQKLGGQRNIPSAFDTVKRFKDDASKGLDGNIIEYLYLSDLFLLITEHKLYKVLGYKDQDAFEKGSGKLKGIRNAIAYPNKSLVKSHDTLCDLWMAIMKIEELKECLDRSWI